MVHYRNTSTNKTFMGFWRYDIHDVGSSFFWRIISPSGEDLSPKPGSPVSFFGSGSLIRLAPAQESGGEWDLSSVCDWAEVGTYQIVLRLHLDVLGTREGVTAESNLLKVTRVRQRRQR